MKSSECRAANTVLRTLGTGAFHCGLEVHQREWSYEGEGIYCCGPKLWSQGSYFEAVPLGSTEMSEDEVFEALDRMEQEGWIGDRYDLLEKNCCHFCDALSVSLRVDSVPTWVLNLASAGVTLRKTTALCLNTCCCSNPKSTVAAKKEGLAPSRQARPACGDDVEASCDSSGSRARLVGSSLEPRRVPAPLRLP
eukprot:CAMPEP_0171073426 /NCGR_PEP_ID=MMETSP0766_2-20121228/11507_1 /TAXON_ID=439317 /ORGANISM="Gambierdiscus australes, Strain CAWD 149" /LENGTH=193 /DNA_ID=CAMNT_0011530117 /DNA_START=78 /DNA_END=655 /DNA_ORIENTATION=-